MKKKLCTSCKEEKIESIYFSSKVKICKKCKSEENKRSKNNHKLNLSASENRWGRFSFVNFDGKMN